MGIDGFGRDSKEAVSKRWRELGVVEGFGAVAATRSHKGTFKLPKAVAPVQCKVYSKVCGQSRGQFSDALALTSPHICSSPDGHTPSLTSASSASSSKPAGAWSGEETALYMLYKVRLGEFYVLVPDNETKREVDQLRIMWAAADVAEGRPVLSRWHANWKALYEEYVREGLAQLE
ncbi:LOW QUALITY PROTEIN: hypothetical protein CVT25_010502 [Psilocybe cyanescens]|uniref:Uncharacterized protein n=1 Tax=Psilocybe cyanescens TaxID=93625 RepID=A0A409X2L6_PSICY|nr:LOW QUALITY PROTEIN: hypothetical protein CVT25_010502 [Psilocybe cyanescens]